MLTVNPSELHGMLVDLQRSAGTDSTLPMLDGVLLHVANHNDATVLVGTSTNRFIIGQAHAPITGEMPVTFLPGIQVKQLLGSLKNYVKNEKLLCELSHNGDTLTAKLPGDIVLPSLTITVKCGDGDNFPKVANVFDAELKVDEGALAFNSRFIAAVSAIARRRNESLRVALSHNKKPSHFYVGSQYKAMVMPTHDSDASIAPTFLPPDELAKKTADAARDAAKAA